jgi:Tol biopolymer transport system component
LHGLQIAVPRWSPDGKAIAFIGGQMSEQAGGNSQLARSQLQGDRSSQSVATNFAPPVFSISGSVGDGRNLAAKRKPSKDGPTHWSCHKLAVAFGVGSDAMHGAWQRRA